jgi:hypothetical protein
MKASLAQLDNVVTAGARLPMLCESKSSNFEDGGVLGTGLIWMSYIFAVRTDDSIALNTNYIGFGNI